MIIVEIKGKETLEKGLKTLKRKFDRQGTIKELRRRKTYQKPSDVRREEVKKAYKRDKWIRENG
jgi:small subunit ribosomal protein S21